MSPSQFSQAPLFPPYSGKRELKWGLALLDRTCHLEQSTRTPMLARQRVIGGAFPSNPYIIMDRLITGSQTIVLVTAGERVARNRASTRLCNRSPVAEALATESP